MLVGLGRKQGGTANSTLLSDGIAHSTSRGAVVRLRKGGSQMLQWKVYSRLSRER